MHIILLEFFLVEGILPTHLSLPHLDISDEISMYLESHES